MQASGAGPPKLHKVVWFTAMTEQNERLPLKPPKDCELAEILQYQCEIGMSQVVCNPFVRVFAK